MLMRRKDWAARLELYLEANAKRKFQYGVWDCCLFACGAIESMTDRDPAEWFRGKYETAAGAVKLMRAAIGRGSVKAIVEQVATQFDMTEITTAHARRGDVALIRRARGWSVGIVALNGSQIVVAAEKGLMRIPILRAARAWQV